MAYRPGCDCEVCQDFTHFECKICHDTVVELKEDPWVPFGICEDCFDKGYREWIEAHENKSQG